MRHVASLLVLLLVTGCPIGDDDDTDDPGDDDDTVDPGDDDDTTDPGDDDDTTDPGDDDDTTDPGDDDDGFLHVDGGELVDGAGQPYLPRCISVPGFMDPGSYMIGNGAGLLAANHEIWGRLEDVIGAEARDAFLLDFGRAYLASGDLDRAAGAGANCVRVPLNHHEMVASWDGATVTLDEDHMALLDELVPMAADRDMVLFLDLHAAPGGQNGIPTVADVPSDDWTARLWTGGTAEDNQDQTVALWEALAQRYAGEPAVGGYDLLNEPALPWDVPASDMIDLYERVIAAIRAVDAEHLIILEGDALATDLTMFTEVLDPNTVLQFHGYSWDPSSPTALESHLQVADDLDLPLWMGEFGESNLEWQQQMVALVEGHGIGWALWPYKRIHTWDDNLVAQEIVPPDDWDDHVYPWLTGAWGSVEPTEAEALAAMAGIIEAVRVENCTESSEVLALYGS